MCFVGRVDTLGGVEVMCVRVVCVWGVHVWACVIGLEAVCVHVLPRASPGSGVCVLT